MENKTTRAKTGGRRANTPNRINAQSKQIIADLVNSEVLKIPELLDKLKPKDRLEIIVKLISFVVPKQTKIELEADLPERFIPVLVNLTIEAPEPLKIEK
jgi:hypothetical protein